MATLSEPARPTAMFRPSVRARAWLFGAAAAVLLASPHALADATAPKPPPPTVPAELEGKWWGTVRHGDETSELGLEFKRRPNGRVLAREWLPNVNAYGPRWAGWNSRTDNSASAARTRRSH